MCLTSKNIPKRVIQLLMLIVLCLLINSEYLIAQDNIECPLNVDYLVIAQNQHTSGNFESAIESITCAISQGDTNSQIYAYRGTMYLAIEQPSEAIIDFDSAIEIDNTISNYYYLRGIAYSTLQDIEYTIEDFTEALYLEPSNVDYYFSLADIYMQIDDVEQATEILNQAITNNPDDAKAYAQRGYFFYMIEKYDRSKDDFAIAIELEPMIASIYFHRGNVEFSTNFLELAITSFTIALLIESEYAEVYRQRAVAYIKLGETEKANNDIDHAYAIDNDPTHYAVIAYIYNVLGDSENALANYKTFLNLADEDDVDKSVLDIINFLEETLDDN